MALIAVTASIVILSISLTESGFAKMKVISITGEGFGNNGIHFRSFVDCPKQQDRFFYGGSHINFTADLSNNKPEKKSIGTWMIEYKSGTLSEFNTLSKGGYFTNATMNGRHYTLTGFETTDRVCTAQPTSIVLTGECGVNIPISYTFANGEKIGSTVPPNGNKVYYFFGSSVQCR
jgi:hypothetical protein